MTYSSIKGIQKSTKTEGGKIKYNDVDMDLDYLKSIVDYDPETGIFRRKRVTRGHYIGSEMGGINDQGYVIITIDKVKYRAHRLAFKSMTG